MVSKSYDQSIFTKICTRLYLALQIYNIQKFVFAWIHFSCLSRPIRVMFVCIDLLLVCNNKYDLHVVCFFNSMDLKNSIEID